VTETLPRSHFFPLSQVVLSPYTYKWVFHNRVDELDNNYPCLPPEADIEDCSKQSITLLRLKMKKKIVTNAF
jgi:hypothetical protein